MRYLVSIFVVVFFILSGCSRQNNTLTCDGQSTKNALLNHLDDATSLAYYTRELINIKILKKNDNYVFCSASLFVRSSLDNKLTTSVPVTYNVYAGSLESRQLGTLKLNLTNEGSLKLNNWVASLNELAKHLGYYELTPNGALYVLKESEQQVLYFNGQKIIPEVSNSTINIEKRYVLDDKYVFLIGSYTGGTIDADTRNNMLIQIESNSKYTITRNFGYQNITLGHESLVISGIAPGRIYAESDDFPIYNYKDGELTIARDVKPESYYMVKFAAMKPIDIVNIAKADKCFDNISNLLDKSHVCKYAMKYCFMYEAIKVNSDDRYYQILKKSCD